MSSNTEITNTQVPIVDNNNTTTNQSTVGSSSSSSFSQNIENSTQTQQSQQPAHQTQPNQQQQQQYEIASKQAQLNQFAGDLEKQLHGLEQAFSRQIADLRKKLYAQTVEIQDETATSNINNQTNNTNPVSNITGNSSQTNTSVPTNNTTTNNNQPVNYSVHYSSSSIYKDGVRDTKEHIEFKHPEINIVADRIPGKEEFEVKALKLGETEPKVKHVSADQLKHDIDHLYGSVQNKYLEAFPRVGFPYGARYYYEPLFGSLDLPLLQPSQNQPVNRTQLQSHQNQPVNSTQLQSPQNQPVNSTQPQSHSSGNSLATGAPNREDTRLRRPYGSDFFRDEIFNIDKEMELMRRRMDWEMKRFFDF